MIEVYEEWSDRDRRKSASKQLVSAPDISSMRRGITALRQPSGTRLSSSNGLGQTRQINDKEYVNLDDPYPYDEPSQHLPSTTRTVVSASSTAKSYPPSDLLKPSSVTVKTPPAPPTPDFQPPPTPEFQAPPTPQFGPPPASPLLRTNEQPTKWNKR
jgi:hypothetical protein